jgi:hypothetical protein
MLRRSACLGLLAAVLLLGSNAGAAAETPDAPGGFGRFWQEPPPGPDPTGELARLAGRHNAVNAAKLALAAAAAGLLAWGAWLSRAGRPRAHARLRDALLAGLGVAGLLGWWNFFQFHYPGYVHTHEVFNYYVGAKYFRELGYKRLYDCVALADLRAGLRERVLRRQMTDLETYAVVGTSGILSEPGRCTRRFSPARWQAFRDDVAFFRSRLSPELWEELQRDHGYNPPPAWGLAGTLLARTAPASTRQILLLTLLDPLLLAALWGSLCWAFGWRATCVALLYWGTNHPAEFSWTGGAFLRSDWLAATGVGLCLLRRGHPFSGGFLLGLAALLRLFPALALLGIGLAALLGAARARRPALPPAQLRLAAGAALAAALVLPLSSLVAGGAGAWRAFAENTRLHVGTPGNNAMGLGTVLSYTTEGRFAALEGKSADPGRAWKEARQDARAQRRGLFLALAGLYLLLLARSLLGQPDWAAALLGLGALPVLLTPTCYYTGALFFFALLWPRRPSIGVALCLLSLAQWLVAARFHAFDELYTWSGLAAVLFAVYATAAARLPRRAAPERA